MASLQKIRNHGIALLIIVGLAMLAFILGDLFSSGSTLMNRSREVVGKVNGEKINIRDFEAAREQLTEVYKIESGRSDMDEEMQSNLNNQVWQMMVENIALTAAAGEVGMVVTDDELSEQCIGENPHQLIRTRRAFFDQSGQFNRLALLNFLSSLEQADESADNGQLRQAKSYWMYWENAVRLTYLQEKYTGLLGELVGANKLEAQDAFNARQNSVDVEYVMQPYYAIADSLVSVKESEISARYQKNKKQYKQTPNRQLAYVAFDIVPSEQDFKDVETWINNLSEEFKTTDDVAALVNSNSDENYTGADLAKEDVPEYLQEFAFANGRKAGDVSDIMFVDNTYSMARVMENNYQKPDSVQLRYLVLSNPAELDSLKNEWKAGRYGDANELGWLKAKDLPKEIAEKAFSAKKNDILDFPYGAGLQVLQLIDISAPTPKIKLAILSREVSPSSKTYANIFNQAKQFAVQNNTDEKFRQAAEEQGLTLQPAYGIQKNSQKVASLPSSRQIVRWAFDHKQGAVSDVYECGNQYVIALITEVNDGEYRSLEQVSSEIRMELVREKKAELIKSNLANLTSLEDAAGKVNAEVQTAENVTASAYRFGSAGSEPAVIGEALRLTAGELSKPIGGNTGVFVLKGGEKKTADGTLNEENEINTLKQRLSYQTPYQLLNQVIGTDNVVDNRSNFY